MAVKPIASIDDPRYARALAHPLRIRILAMLEEQAASPVQLAGRLEGVSVSVVAYHVRTLLYLGLLELVTTRPRRGAIEHIYRAFEHPRFTDEAWEALGPVAKQRLLTAMLQQTGAYASTSAAAGGFDRADAHITRTALKLDERGFSQLAAATKQWLGEVQRIQAAAGKRLRSQSAQHQPLDVGLVLMLFAAMPFSAAPRPLPAGAGDADGHRHRRTPRNDTPAPART